MTNPLVSVIVPTYNRPEDLQESLKCLVKQTYPHFEGLIINDGGVDVEKVVAGFKDDRLKYFAHKHNKGIAAARNSAIGHAKGKYIAYLDDDDRFYPVHLKLAIDALSNSSNKVVYTDGVLNWKKLKNETYVSYSKTVFSFSFTPDDFLIDSVLPLLPFVHERSCLDTIGLFDETFQWYEDWDLLIRLMQKYPFLHVPKITVEYIKREESSQLTRDWIGNLLNALQIIHARYKDNVKDIDNIQKKQFERRELLRYVALDQIENMTQERFLSANIEKIMHQIASSSLQLTREDIRGARALCGFLLQRFPDQAGLQSQFAELSKILS